MSSKLAKVILDNLEFFKLDKSGQKFFEAFQSLLKVLTQIAPIIKEIESFSNVYDFDESTPGNGYRSFVYLVDCAVQRLLQICDHVKNKRESYFFRKSECEKELAEYVEVFRGLKAIGLSLIENHKKASGDSPCLLSEEGVFDNTIRQTMKTMNLHSFYGRAFLFHYHSSLRISGKGLAIFMALYSEFYYSDESLILKLLRLPQSFWKYLVSPTTLSIRLQQMFNNCTVEFGRTMLDTLDWRHYGIIQHLSEHKVEVNEVVQIPTEPLQIYSETLKQLIDIPVPSSHIGNKPVSCRIISKQRRCGMSINGSCRNEAAASRYLIFHAHGGGWATQSSKLHASYTKEWAKKLDVPVASIDYSLAPEAPFPRAVEEIFYAYCWILKNPELFGWTGENIVFVGDSAGANLVATCVIRCIETGAPKPKGMLNIYAAYDVNYIMTPSRFMGLFDIILPYMSHMRLFNAYNGVQQTSECVKVNRKVPLAPSNEFDFKVSQSHLISPRLAPCDVLSEFPPTIVLSTTLDSCLDEDIEFAKKLRMLGVDVKFELLEGLNHGFLNFTHLSREANQGVKSCTRCLSDLLGLND